MTFTVLAVLFICFTWSRVILRYKDRSIHLAEFLFWTAIWLTALVLVIQPGISFLIATKLGIMRGADVAIYTSIALLFYLVFRIYIKISSIDHEITRLVRALALKDKKEAASSQSKLSLNGEKENLQTPR